MSLPSIFTECIGKRELCKDTNISTTLAMATSDVAHPSPYVSFCGVDMGIDFS